MTVPAATILDLPGASSLTVTAGRIDFAGQIYSTSGTVDLSVRPTAMAGSTPTTGRRSSYARAPPSISLAGGSMSGR